jgi:hypothetical protein
MTETKQTPCRSNTSTIFAKSVSARVRAIDLVEDRDVDKGEHRHVMPRVVDLVAVAERAGMLGSTGALLAANEDDTGVANFRWNGCKWQQLCLHTLNRS